MFKKITATALVALSLVSVLPLNALATSERVSTMDAVGIIDSSTNLYSNVTRGAFAEMLVNASVYAEGVGTGYGYSLYTDVKSNHTQSAYIKVAAENGWMTGYIDGSFKPEQAMKLEEAVSAILKLLGYTNADLVGAYPYAQMSKASSLGILDGVSAVQGQTITTDDAVDLFYNALLAENKQGIVYGTTLGYSVSGDSIDYASLVNEGTKGPYVTYDGGISVPFSLTDATIYLNGETVTADSIDAFDVYYYHADMNTVWVYDDKVSGTITAISPSEVAPTAVTVAGVSYSIGTSNATYQLSSQGTYKVGDTVTLLLGMDGKISEAVDSTQINNEYYGVAISSTTTSSATGEFVQTSTTVACTDGVERTFLHNGTAYEDGKAVNVKISSQGTVITALAANSISGTVNSTATKLGNYTLASDIEILETDDDGNYTKIYPSTLANKSLNSQDVLYYKLNTNGQISHLILDGVTGNTYTYGYVISENEVDSGMQLMGTYEVMIDGKIQTMTTNGSLLNVSLGGASISYDDGKVSSINEMNEVEIDEINGFTAYDNDTKYTVSENVDVILKDGTNYIATTLDAVETSNYNLTGYYDDTGKQIRILIAEIN